MPKEVTKTLSEMTDAELARYIKHQHGRRKWARADYDYPPEYYLALEEERSRARTAKAKHKAEIAATEAQEAESIKQREQAKLRVRSIREYGAHEIP